MKAIRLVNVLILLLVNILLLSCGGGGIVPQEQAKKLLTLLQNANIDKCAEMVYVYQINMQKIRTQPEFKQRELIASNLNDVKDKFFNEQATNSIIYLFRFPCQWQILETKQMTQESSGINLCIPTTFFRVFAVLKYNSMAESPDSVPLLFKEGGFSFKIKEIILHCDFEKNTGLYLGWGLEQHTPW